MSDKKIIIGVKTDKETAAILANLVWCKMGDIPYSYEPRYDNVFGVGDYIVSEVMGMNPVLRNHTYDDIKHFNVDCWSMKLTTSPVTHRYKDVKNGLKDVILSVDDYIKYFGRYIIPMSYGPLYWIKSIENLDLPEWTIIYDYKYDEEIEFIKKNGRIFELNDMEDTVDEICDYIILSKVLNSSRSYL